MKIFLLLMTMTSLFGVSAAYALDQSTADQHILKKLHQINLTEITAGKLAEQKAQAPDVKSFARTLVKDHTKADQLVSQVAQKEGVILTDEASTIPMPADVQKDHDMIVKLEGMTDGDFDVAYQKMMKDGHQQAIAALTAAEPNLQQRDVQNLVKKLIPSFEHHEAMSQHLYSENGSLIRSS